MDAANYSAYSGYAHLGAGLTVGMSSLAAGLAIGIVGDAGVRANAQQPRLFVGEGMLDRERDPKDPKNMEEFGNFQEKTWIPKMAKLVQYSSTFLFLCFFTVVN